MHGHRLCPRNREPAPRTKVGSGRFVAVTSTFVMRQSNVSTHVGANMFHWVCWSVERAAACGRFLAMKRAVPRATKQKRARRTPRKPGVKWRESEDHSSDESVVIDERGQAQPKNYRSAQRSSRRRT